MIAHEHHFCFVDKIDLLHTDACRYYVSAVKALIGVRWIFDGCNSGRQHAVKAGSGVARPPSERFQTTPQILQRGREWMFEVSACQQLKQHKTDFPFEPEPYHTTNARGGGSFVRLQPNHALRYFIMVGLAWHHRKIPRFRKEPNQSRHWYFFCSSNVHKNWHPQSMSPF